MTGPASPSSPRPSPELNRRANQLAALLLDLGRRRRRPRWSGAGRTRPGCCSPSTPSARSARSASRSTTGSAPDEAAYVIDNCDAQVVYVDAEYAELIAPDPDRTPKVTRRAGLRRRRRARGAGWTRYPTDDVDRRPARPTGATMIYTSGTTGKPKGAVRARRPDSAPAAGLIGLIGYQPDDVYLTTGPLYHSGPGGFAAMAHALGNTVVVQHKFDPEDWLRLVDDLPGDHHLHRADADPDGLQPARRGEGPLRPVQHERLIANAAPVDAGAEEDVPGRLPARFAVGGVRLDRARRRHRARGPRTTCASPGSCGQPAPGIEIKLFDDDGPRGHRAVRRRGSCTCGRRPCSAPTTRREEKYEARPPGRLPHRRRHRLPRRGGLLLHRRPQERHDHQRRHEHLPGRDRGRPRRRPPTSTRWPSSAIPSEEWGESVHAVVVPARPGVTEADVIGLRPRSTWPATRCPAR